MALSVTRALQAIRRHAATPEQIAENGRDFRGPMPQKQAA
jgi:hypothetical protein